MSCSLQLGESLAHGTPSITLAARLNDGGGGGGCSILAACVLFWLLSMYCPILQAKNPRPREVK